MKMMSTPPTAKAEFKDVLKYWRNARKLSQLELALAANVSQRHVSWLETGRSQPSRDMVLRLCKSIDVPLRDRNQLLSLAGYAKLFSERQLDEPAMTPVLSAVTAMLEHHEPYPAMVLDRLWNIKMKNQAADALIGLVGDTDLLWQSIGDTGEYNLALLTLHENGLRRFVNNWEDIAGPFLRRLKREAIDSGDLQVMAKYQDIEAKVGILDESNSNAPLLPVLPIELVFGELEISLFSVISTIGTPQDVTADELRIETFYPTDQSTADFFSKRIN